MDNVTTDPFKHWMPHIETICVDILETMFVYDTSWMLTVATDSFKLWLPHIETTCVHTLETFPNIDTF